MIQSVRHRPHFFDFLLGPSDVPTTYLSTMFSHVLEIMGAESCRLFALCLGRNLSCEETTPTSADGLRQTLPERHRSHLQYRCSLLPCRERWLNPHCGFEFWLSTPNRLSDGRRWIIRYFCYDSELGLFAWSCAYVPEPAPHVQFRAPGVPYIETPPHGLLEVALDDGLGIFYVANRKREGAEYRVTIISYA